MACPIPGWQGRMVVHSMADGEWGGVQFQVRAVTKQHNGKPV